MEGLLTFFCLEKMNFLLSRLIFFVLFCDNGFFVNKFNQSINQVLYKVFFLSSLHLTLFYILYLSLYLTIL